MSNIKHIQMVVSTGKGYENNTVACIGAAIRCMELRTLELKKADIGEGSISIYEDSIQELCNMQKQIKSHT